MLEPLTCAARVWQPALPATGNAMMAYRDRTYLLGSATMWTIAEAGSATTSAIPLPAGITQMLAFRAEIAPSGRPFVVFQSEGQSYGAFFDGTQFVKVTAIGSLDAHADGAERMYATGQNGLVEYEGATVSVRGGLPKTGPGWTVGSNGDVHVLYTENGAGDRIDLKVTHLPHGQLSWQGADAIGWNAGYGWSGARWAVGQDGSLHVGYALSSSMYEYRSHDGVTWDRRYPLDILSTATLVETLASPSYNDPTRVGGDVVRLAAQDYEHVVFVRAYNGGSMSNPGFYVTRSCAPFVGTSETWPSERFSLSVSAYQWSYPNAVNERGLVSLLSYFGIRQESAQ